jgi:hypothetical protein
VRAALLALALTAAPAAAGEMWLLGPGASYHFQRNGYNELHPGLGAERRAAALAWAAFVQENSYRQLSFYAAGSWQPWRLLGARLGGTAGLANGYGDGRREKRALSAAPFFGLALSIEGRRWGANVALLPGLLFVQSKWRLP